MPHTMGAQFAHHDAPRAASIDEERRQFSVVASCVLFCRNALVQALEAIPTHAQSRCSVRLFGRDTPLHDDTRFSRRDTRESCDDTRLTRRMLSSARIWLSS